MTSAYMGKILRLDLSTRKVSIEATEEDVVKKYIGGSGLGAKILFDETSADTNPLGPGNVLIREALFLARNSARENHLVIIILLAVLIEEIGMVFPQKCQ